MSAPTLVTALRAGLRNTSRALIPLAVGTFLVALYLVTSRPIFFTDLLVFPVVVWGLVRLHLDAAAGEPSWAALIAGLRGNPISRIGRMLGLLLIWLVVAFPIGLLLWAGGAALTLGLVFAARDLVGPVDRVVWALVQVSPVLAAVPLVRFLLAPFALVDQDLGLVEALTTSWRLSRGRLAFLLALCTATIVLAVLLAMAWQAVAEIPQTVPFDQQLEAWAVTLVLHLGLAQIGLGLAMFPVAALAVLYRAARQEPE